MKKLVVLKGVVTKFVMANPHSQLYFDVTDDQGNIAHWGAEMRNPLTLEGVMARRKDLMEKFAPGTIVTVTGNPSKAGTPVMVFGKGRAC